MAFQTNSSKKPLFVTSCDLSYGNGKTYKCNTLALDLGIFLFFTYIVNPKNHISL